MQALGCAASLRSLAGVAAFPWRVDFGPHLVGYRADCRDAFPFIPRQRDAASNASGHQVEAAERSDGNQSEDGTGTDPPPALAKPGRRPKRSRLKVGSGPLVFGTLAAK